MNEHEVIKEIDNLFIKIIELNNQLKDCRIRFSDENDFSLKEIHDNLFIFNEDFSIYDSMEKYLKERK